jgi:hypothetical protein
MQNMDLPIQNVQLCVVSLVLVYDFSIQTILNVVSLLAAVAQADSQRCAVELVDAAEAQDDFDEIVVVVVVDVQLLHVDHFDNKKANKCNNIILSDMLQMDCRTIPHNTLRCIMSITSTMFQRQGR